MRANQNLDNSVAQVLLKTMLTICQAQISIADVFILVIRLER
jgi:hypothetical protein